MSYPGAHQCFLKWHQPELNSPFSAMLSRRKICVVHACYKLLGIYQNTKILIPISRTVIAGSKTFGSQMNTWSCLLCLGSLSAVNGLIFFVQTFQLTISNLTSLNFHYNFDPPLSGFHKSVTAQMATLTNSKAFSALIPVLSATLRLNHSLANL